MNLEQITDRVVGDSLLHAKWLNTLSLMENTGARKISASEDKSEVTLIVLKHAAEEHRHAYYLKKQIEKIDKSLCTTYSAEFLIAPASSKFYLNKLDTSVCRYLKEELKLGGKELRFAAYLLVTYAIEVRADEIYPIYQSSLDKVKSKVNVKSIIVEEEGHLEEMINQLKQFSHEWEKHAAKAVEIESTLFKEWLVQLAKEVA